MFNSIYNPSFKKIAAICFLIFTTLVANAQNATNYVFSTTTGATLDAMTGSTSLIGASVDDGVSAVTNIGFPFMYENVAYTQFSVNSNGLIRLGGTAVSNDWTNALSDNSEILRLCQYGMIFVQEPEEV